MLFVSCWVAFCAQDVWHTPISMASNVVRNVVFFILLIIYAAKIGVIREVEWIRITDRMILFTDFLLEAKKDKGSG